MIGNDILCLGLSRTEKQTLLCNFPIGFSFFDVTADDLTKDSLLDFVSKAWCVFINPKALKIGQLRDIVQAQGYAASISHAAVLLFTKPFTAEQRASTDTRLLHRVDLRASCDIPLRDAVTLVRRAIMPHWNGMARMRANMFNDGWYLLDMETTGIDPLEDEILSISLSYMAGYKIQYTDTFYIRQTAPIAPEVEAQAGITNAMLEEGITREQAVERLNNLPSPSPLVLESTKYCLPFLKALYHFCGQSFDLPYIAIDGLAAIAFSYKLCKNPLDILPALEERKYPRTPLDHPYLAKLYDLTLAVFENLQERYGVRSAGDLKKLYTARIECGE